MTLAGTVGTTASVSVVARSRRSPPAVYVAALSGRATAEMLADLRDRGGLRAMEADRKRWQQLGPNPPREPTIFEAWDGDERSLTVRHYVGNGVCAYFEGFSAYRAGAGVYTVLIGT